MTAPATTANFTQWLNTFIDEKGIDTSHILSVQGPEWGENLIPVEVVLEHMRITTAAEQAAIKDMLVRIDFHNGNIMHYLAHLAQALAY